jgi:SAM-dependent methyltransferase
MTTPSTFLATDGDGYELQMGRWSRRLAEPFLDFVGTADGERVLDVGCGTGSLAFALMQRCRVGQLLGIDVAPVYVAHAAHRNTDANASFEVADACALPYADAAFDRVLALLVLHFVANPQQAVAEMKRVARPGAVVAACVWDVRGGWVANRMFFDTAAMLDRGAIERRAKNYTRPLTRPGELARAWRDAGLADVVETTLGIRTDYASFDDYWAPVDGKDGPHAEYVSTLDSGARARLRDAVRLAYLDGEADGPRSYSATAWAVKGIVAGQQDGDARADRVDGVDGSAPSA